MSAPSYIGLGYIGFSLGLADSDGAGLMPAGELARLTGIPPTDPTTAPSAEGASYTYVIATTDTIQSTYGNIANLTGRYCWDEGRAANGTLKTLLLYPGYRQPHTQFPDAMLKRLASYGFLVIAITPPGIGDVDGDNDYTSSAQAGIDVSVAVATIAESAGATVYNDGRSARWVGYSTGAVHVLRALATIPAAVDGAMVFAPNWDLGVGRENYWYRNTFARTTLATDIGDRGLGTPAEVDPYIVRYPQAIQRILALRECTCPVYVFGDDADADATPLGGSATDLVALLGGSSAEAKSKIRDYSTGYLHSDAPNSGTAIEAENRWVPALLSASSWTMPRRAKGLLLSGQLDTGRTVLTLGATSTPDGNSHVATLDYDDVRGRYDLLPITSTNGYALASVSGQTDYLVQFTAGVPFAIDFAETPTITSLSSVGITDAWLSDAHVTGGATVTAWGKDIGTGNLATATANPADVVDSGVHAVRFTRANTERLSISSIPIRPDQDYTIYMVLNDRSGTNGQYYGELRNVGGKSALSFWRSGSAFRVSYLTASGAEGMNSPQLAMSTGARHFIAIMREGNAVSLSIDGSVPQVATVTDDSFTVGGSMAMILGSQLTNDGTTIFNGSDVDVCLFASRQSASTPTEVNAARKYAKARFDF